LEGGDDRDRMVAWGARLLDLGWPGAAAPRRGAVIAEVTAHRW